jgi:mannose-6-phosphate isomerase
MSYDRLPFRISIIDAKDDLSIQVHPTEAYAHQTGLSSGLSEAWIILEAIPDARIQLGHHGISKEELKKMIHLQQWNDLLRYEPVVKGEVFYIEAGTMHAIGKGILVYEISQAVDVTYRIYDYDRVDSSTNKKRELHVEQALDVLTVPDKGGHRVEFSTVVFDSYRHSQLIRTRFFNVDVYDVEKQTDLTLDNWGFLTVISSQGTINGVYVKTGETYLISSRHRRLTIDGDITFIFASEGKNV